MQLPLLFLSQITNIPSTIYDVYTVESKIIILISIMKSALFMYLVRALREIARAPIGCLPPTCQDLNIAVPVDCPHARTLSVTESRNTIAGDENKFKPIKNLTPERFSRLHCVASYETAEQRPRSLGRPESGNVASDARRPCSGSFCAGNV